MATYMERNAAYLATVLKRETTNPIRYARQIAAAGGECAAAYAEAANIIEEEFVRHFDAVADAYDKAH